MAMGDVLMRRSDGAVRRSRMMRHSAIAITVASGAAGCASNQEGGELAADRDAANDSAVQLEYYESVESLSAASDLVVKADVRSVGLSEYQPEGVDYDVAAIELDPVDLYGARRSVGEADPMADGVDVLWSLSGVTETDWDVEMLSDHLPQQEGIWFLRWEPELLAYRIVNFMAVWTPVERGYHPTLYLASAQAADNGLPSPRMETSSMLDEIVQLGDTDVTTALRGAAAGVRPDLTPR